MWCKISVKLLKFPIFFSPESLLFLLMYKVNLKFTLFEKIKNVLYTSINI